MEKRVVQKINTCLLFLNRRRKIELPLPNLKREQPIEKSDDALEGDEKRFIAHKSPKIGDVS